MTRFTIAFWNHPLVVKAFRAKYRGGRMFVLASAYLVVLAAVGMAIFRYYQPASQQQAALLYLVVILSVQFLLSAAVAASAVAGSMNAEVSTGTLDLQRIAGLSPAQILWGKMVGEPAGSYLLAVATVPLAVLCSLMGAAGIEVLALMYLTLLTTTLMVAAIGLQHSLERPAPGKPSGSRMGCTGGLIFGVWMCVSMSFARGLPGQLGELTHAVVGLFTPIMTLRGLWAGDLWAERMAVFDLQVPYAVLTPAAQLAVAAFAFHGMSRRLNEPLRPYVGRVQLYLSLLLVDLAAAAYTFGAVHDGQGLTGPGVSYLVAHAIAALVLAMMAAPKWETYSSWVWRFRRRGRWWWAVFLGDRNLIGGPLIACCGLGLGVFAATVGLPAALLFPDELAQTAWRPLAVAVALSVLVLLAYGLLYQVLALVAGRQAGAVLVLIGAVALVAPIMAGEYYGESVVSSFSPAYVLVRLSASPAEVPPPLPVLALHAAAAVLCGYVLWRIRRRCSQVVHGKLRAMGVC